MLVALFDQDHLNHEPAHEWFAGKHVFWPDEVSLRDQRLFRRAVPGTHRQVTDIYLLGHATQGGRLATFDRRIPTGAVIGAERGHLEVIPA